MFYKMIFLIFYCLDLKDGKYWNILFNMSCEIVYIKIKVYKVLCTINIYWWNILEKKNFFIFIFGNLNLYDIVNYGYMI